MVFRYRRGWATAANAEEYERIVTSEVLPSIAARLHERSAHYEVRRTPEQTR